MTPSTAQRGKVTPSTVQRGKVTPSTAKRGKVTPSTAQRGKATQSTAEREDSLCFVCRLLSRSCGAETPTGQAAMLSVCQTRAAASGQLQLPSQDRVSETCFSVLATAARNNASKSPILLLDMSVLSDTSVTPTLTIFYLDLLFLSILAM